MVTRTVIITTPEQEKAFNDFVKSNPITVKYTASPDDLAHGHLPQMKEEDWNHYFENHPLSKTGKTAKKHTHKLV